MTPNPVTVRAEDRASAAAALMAHHRFGALPVTEAEAPVLVGIVTAADMLKHCAVVLRSPAEA